MLGISTIHLRCRQPSIHSTATLLRAHRHALSEVQERVSFQPFCFKGEGCFSARLPRGLLNRLPIHPEVN